jgi:hypothetical protein
MTSFAHVHYPLQHPGVVRAERAVGAFDGLAAAAHRAVLAVANIFRAWADARRRAAEDAQYWQAALNDARIMADISRAMSAAATRDARN